MPTTSYSYRRTSSSGCDLIPVPHCQPGRIYVGDGKKLSLQEQMGMTACSDLLSEILSVVRNTCREHGVDLNLPYGRQNPTVLRAVTRELLDKLPVLREYEDGWPIKFYLARELKSHYPSPGNPRYLRLRNERRRSRTPFTTRSGRQTVCSRRTRRTKAPVARPSKRVTHLSSRSESPSTVYRDESDVERQLQPLPAHGMMTPPPSPDSGPSSSSYSELQILDIILAALVPPADAQRLVELLASKGINDLAYMRVLARMSTRDSWLEELVREGKITEIQMRVLQEILERHK